MGKLVYFVAGSNSRTFPGAQGCPLMINAYRNCRTAGDIEETKQLLSLANPAFVATDSGGFQNLKAQEKLLAMEPPDQRFQEVPLPVVCDPLIVVEAGSRMKPTILFALDYPVRRLKEQAAREMDFKQKFQINVDWTIESYRGWEKSCRGTAFFIPIQAYNLAQFHLFVRAIDGIRFHGVGLPLRNVNLYETGLFMTRFWQLGVESIHLLGVTAYFSNALGAYLARNYFRWVSADSQTWHTAASHSEYLSPYDLSRVKVTRNMIIPEGTELDCQCPFCRGRTFAYIRHLPFDDRRVFLSGHNYFVTEKAFRDLYKHAGSIRTLVSFVDSRARNKEKVQELYDTLCLIETFKDKDLRYFEDLIPKKGAK